MLSCAGAQRGLGTWISLRFTRRLVAERWGLSRRTPAAALLDSSVMPEPARKRAIYSDLDGIPDHVVAEILDGELFTSPRPTPRHARAASSLGGELYGPFDRGRGGPGGWIILDEPELHLSGDALVPDLGGWRRERMPVLPEVTAFELAPDPSR